MNLLTIIIIVAGLCLFEVINSVDNAIINAQVLSTMSKRTRRWFLIWGMLFAVFVVRGLLPWVIVWISAPSLGPIGALTATFSNNVNILHSIERSSPILLMGGGVFLLFLFLHWIFLEKKFGKKREASFFEEKIWFFGAALVILAVITWFSFQIRPIIAFGAIMGSVVFFITNAFKQNAEKNRGNLMKKNLSDINKIIYLEILDATFSMDGVLGAFAFTLSVPLIILGNGLGAFVVRQFTVKNINTIKKYVYLKRGAMLSILFLGMIMIFDGFGFNVPVWLPPIVTFLVVGYFFYKSREYIKKNK